MLSRICNPSCELGSFGCHSRKRVVQWEASSISAANVSEIGGIFEIQIQDKHILFRFRPVAGNHHESSAGSNSSFEGKKRETLLIFS